jgi:hypothetical protein
LREFGQAGDVADDEFLADSAGERGAEHGPHDLYLADGVACLQALVEEHLYGVHGQSAQLSFAQAGDQVKAGDHLVERVGGRAPVLLDDVLQPVLEVDVKPP